MRFVGKLLHGRHYNLGRHLKGENQLDDFLTDLVLLLGDFTVFLLIELHVCVPHLQKGNHKAFGLLLLEVSQQFDNLRLNLVEVLLEVLGEQLFARFVTLRSRWIAILV